jgi:hypothetical protein
MFNFLTKKNWRLFCPYFVDNILQFYHEANISYILDDFRQYCPRIEDNIVYFCARQYCPVSKWTYFLGSTCHSQSQDRLNKSKSCPRNILFLIIEKLTGSAFNSTSLVIPAFAPGPEALELCLQPREEGRRRAPQKAGLPKEVFHHICPAPLEQTAIGHPIHNHQIRFQETPQDTPFYLVISCFNCTSLSHSPPCLTVF